MAHADAPLLAASARLVSQPARVRMNLLYVRSLLQDYHARFGLLEVCTRDRHRSWRLPEWRAVQFFFGVRLMLVHALEWLECDLTIDRQSTNGDLPVVREVAFAFRTVLEGSHSRNI
jgi:hypothetical protein